MKIGDLVGRGRPCRGRLLRRLGCRGCALVREVCRRPDPHDRDRAPARGHTRRFRIRVTRADRVERTRCAGCDVRSSLGADCGYRDRDPAPGASRRARSAQYSSGACTQLVLLRDALKHAEAAAPATRRAVVGRGGHRQDDSCVGASRAKRTRRARSCCTGAATKTSRVPYQPWAEALSHLVEHLPEARLRAHVEQRGGDLLRLVPAVARRVGEVPAPSGDPETERHLLFGAVVDLLSRASDAVDIVLVLDDLHWADRTTVQLLRHVAAATSPLRLLVLGTFRETDIDASHPLTEVLAALHREAGGRATAARRTGRPRAALAHRSVRGHRRCATADVALRDELREETNGNPFFVTEILRHLVETGDVDCRRQHGAPRRGALPVSIREVVGRRVQRLGDDAARVLSTAAVIGRDFDLLLLTRVVDLETRRCSMCSIARPRHS